MEKQPIHINAKKGEIAKIVLMPGDPLRAKKIANEYLENARLVTDTRAMYGYTGEFEGKKITVMGSGMGMPSMGIYSYELFKYYDVDTIIRIGTCGSINPNFPLRCVGMVKSSYNEGEFGKSLTGKNVHISYPSKAILDITKTIYNENKEKFNFPLKEVTICTSECFNEYVKYPENLIAGLPKELDISGFEMEAFALFETAKMFGKKAACFLTVVDASYTDERLNQEQRQEDLDNMIKLALNVAKEL